MLLPQPESKVRRSERIGLSLTMKAQVRALESVFCNNLVFCVGRLCRGYVFGSKSLCIALLEVPVGRSDSCMVWICISVRCLML